MDWNKLALKLMRKYYSPVVIEDLEWYPDEETEGTYSLVFNYGGRKCKFIVNKRTKQVVEY